MTYLTKNAAQRIHKSDRATSELKRIWGMITAITVIREKSGSREMARSAESIVIDGTKEERIFRLMQTIGEKFLAVDRMCGHEVKTSRFLHTENRDELEDLVEELAVLCTTIHQAEDGKKFIFA